MNHSLPPGPALRWWGLKDLRAQRLHHLRFLEDLHRGYGDICHTRVLNEQVVDLFDPKWVQEVMARQASAFQRWERITSIFARTQGPSSLLVSETPQAQRLRRILMPGFSPKRLQACSDLVVQSASRALDRWSSHDPQGIDIERAVTWLTMDVILRTLFSSEASDEAELAESAVRQLLEHGMRELFSPVRLPTWWPLPQLRAAQRAREALDGLVWRHLHARQKALAQGQPQRDDLLGMLMRARDEHSGEGLTDREIRDQCMAIFMAGHVTTASALTWWLWSMATHPTLARRARDEVDQVLGRWRPGYPDLARLPYLTRTLQETLRLYPPVPTLFLQRTLAPVQLGPWQLPKGTLVRISPWVLHRDPRWYPQSEVFDPERFAPEAQAARPRGTYLPFGMGPRSCLGEHFAMAELTLVAAKVLQRFELAPAANAEPADPTMHITLRPRHPLRVSLRLRAHAGQEAPALNAAP